MNSEALPSPSQPPSSECSKETHPLSLPLFLTSSSSSLKPLRERNRTNLKRRINLSRSQVLSNDFENEDTLSTTTTKDKAAAATSITPSSQPQLPSTPTLHTYAELYSKTVSPTTPSPIHTTVTCSQVWERLASNDEQPNSTSPKSPASVPPAAISVLPTHISFSYEPSDDEEREELPPNDNNGFQYVPVSSQSKLVQFQFLTFARQQHLDSNSDDDINKRQFNDSDEDDEDEDEEEENSFLADDIHEYRQEEEEQENRASKKRKRSVSTANSVDTLPSTSAEAASSSTTTKPPCSKKPKIKDPNANYQRLNMRKKNFSHAKKHQFSKHKRNAFYRRMRNAGGK